MYIVHVYRRLYKYQQNVRKIWFSCRLLVIITMHSVDIVFRSQMKSVNRLVSYTADIIAANEEIEYPESKAFIAK